MDQTDTKKTEISQTVPSRATILLAHGSSDPKWCAPFEDMERTIKQTLENDEAKSGQVCLAFMELAEPSLESSVEQLVSTGVHEIQVLPLFFAAGRHLRKDVPAQIEALESALKVKIELMPPVGAHPVMIEALGNIIKDSV